MTVFSFKLKECDYSCPWWSSWWSWESWSLWWSPSECALIGCKSRCEVFAETWPCCEWWLWDWWSFWVECSVLWLFFNLTSFLGFYFSYLGLKVSNKLIFTSFLTKFISSYCSLEKVKLGIVFVTDYIFFVWDFIVESLMSASIFTGLSEDYLFS